MNPFEHLANVQKRHVERTGETVIYTPYGFDPITLKCSVQDGNYKDMNDEFFKTACSFMTLTLDRVPTTADTIVYDGVTFSVGTHGSARRFKKTIDDVEVTITSYDVVAYNKSHNPTAHSQWRRK